MAAATTSHVGLTVSNPNAEPLNHYVARYIIRDAASVSALRNASGHLRLFQTSQPFPETTTSGALRYWIGNVSADHYELFVEYPDSLPAGDSALHVYGNATSIPRASTTAIFLSTNLLNGTGDIVEDPNPPAMTGFDSATFMEGNASWEMSDALNESESEIYNPAGHVPHERLWNRTDIAINWWQRLSANATVTQIFNVHEQELVAVTSDDTPTFGGVSVIEGSGAGPLLDTFVPDPDRWYSYQVLLRDDDTYNLTIRDDALLLVGAREGTVHCCAGYDRDLLLHAGPGFLGGTGDEHAWLDALVVRPTAHDIEPSVNAHLFSTDEENGTDSEVTFDFGGPAASCVGGDEGGGSGSGSGTGSGSGGPAGAGVFAVPDFSWVVALLLALFVLFLAIAIALSIRRLLRGPRREST